MKIFTKKTGQNNSLDMNYHFHARNSDMPLILAELMYTPLGYGMCDYYLLLQRGDLLAGYYSDRGARQMHDYAVENFFNAGKRKGILNGIEAYDTDLHQFVLPKNYWKSATNNDERIKTFQCIKKLLEDFGVWYFRMEQPLLSALEEVVIKACEREGLVSDKVLHDRTLAKNFSKLEEDLLGALIELGHLKFSVHTHVEPLMQAVYELIAYISEEARIPIAYAQSMTIADIEEYFRSGNVPKEDLALRSKGVIFLPRGRGGVPMMGTGEEYDKWKNILEPPFTGEIKGTIACRGKVQGRASLHLGWINITEIPTGNILVTGMTNPQIVHYIKKVAAIVTDEGGMTCHAAIVSREMKIPCIVGTKIATQVLKDGDLVEVDADNGVIKILSA